MHGENRVESKIGWRSQFGPIGFFERGQNPFHAVCVFEIWHAFAAVEDFKRRLVFAVGIGVKYFHGKTILLPSVFGTEEKMDTLESIKTRHSVAKVKAASLPHEMIEKLLDAGNQAPNHYKVRPWRFVVLTGNGRNKLGDVMAASQRDRQPDLPPEASAKTRSIAASCARGHCRWRGQARRFQTPRIGKLRRRLRRLSEHSACRSRAGTWRDLAHRRMGARCEG